jgi:hypothetical protein
MHKPTTVLLAALMLAGGAALAKMPPPTPEEQAAKAASKAKQEEELQRQKAALERAQDRVAERYKREKGSSASAGTSQQTQADNMPRPTSEPAGGVGPKPARPFSAEAHSAPAK